MSIGKRKQKMGKIYFLKHQLVDFGYLQKVIHGSTMLLMADLLSNELHEKVNYMLLKVD